MEHITLEDLKCADSYSVMKWRRSYFLSGNSTRGFPLTIINEEQNSEKKEIQMDVKELKEVKLGRDR